MADPYIAELRLMSFNFVPRGWAQCNGQLLPINQNQPLFALLGTMYGGNGQTNFALPDLRSRVPLHRDEPAYTQGGQLGAESQTLSQAQIPQHTHAIVASSSSGTQAAPAALASADDLYRSATDLTPLNPATIASVGGGQPHENRSPLLALNWCIALVGEFPSRN